MKKNLLLVVFAILGCSPKSEPGGSYLGSPRDIAQSARVIRIDHEPRAGENYGLPRGQAVRELDPAMRKFLDVFLKIYESPKSIKDRKSILELLQFKVMERTYFPTEGKIRPGFREDLSPYGDLSRLGWSGYLYYSSADQKNNSWEMRIDLKVAPEKRACRNSRAVEGYMDKIFWRPSFSLTAHEPFWRSEYWDRHGAFGGVWALPVGAASPSLSLSFVKGCLVQIEVKGNFSLEELSDVEFYN